MAQRSYQRALGRLFEKRRFGVRLELSRTERARERLGRPDASIPHVVQIGGTNGKGSTAALLEAMLLAKGHRVGVFSSPHLVSFRERFRINGQDAGEEDVARALDAVAAADDGSLTFFEIATLAAAWLFADAGVECAIFEVGLGGRFDATTVLERHVTAVTGVALDHQQQLGNTVADIAREKAAIFQSGRPAVIGRAGDPRGREVLLDEARRVGAAVVSPPEPPAHVGLFGAHQRQNACCALAIAACLEDRGMSFDASGLAAARCPGRFEQVAPWMWLDGAHNPDAARALARAVREADLPRPRRLVVGISAGKDVTGIAQALSPVGDQVVTVASGERAISAAELARLWRDACDIPVTVGDSLAAALAPPDAGSVLVTGSLFVVGAARHHIFGGGHSGLDLGDPLGVPFGT